MARFHRGGSPAGTPLPARITEVRADFLRVAGQASWVRAVFFMEAGRFDLFGLGRANERDEPGAAPLGGRMNDQERAIISELYLLTDRAGAIVAELCRAGRVELPLSGDRRDPLEHWLTLLTRESVMQTHCWTWGANRRVPAKDRLDGPAVVWIDPYPQVSATAALWLMERCCHQGINAAAEEVRLDAAIQKMRQAIAVKGKDALPRTLIKEAPGGISEQAGRRALRALEALGEYSGFARRSPGAGADPSQTSPFREG